MDTGVEACLTAAIIIGCSMKYITRARRSWSIGSRFLSRKLLPLASLLVVLAGWNARATAATEGAVSPENSAAAKAAFEQARALSFTSSEAVALYRKASELDPSLYDAHHYYILSYPNAAAEATQGDEVVKSAARERAVLEVIHYYEQLAAAHPQGAVYQWALGIACDYQQPDRAYALYEKAIQLDPKYAPAYDMLAISEDEKGNEKLSLEYAQKATESWPGDLGFWRHYVAASGSADLKKGVALALAGADRFPEGAASIAGYLAGRAQSPQETREIFEAIRAKFPHQALYNYTVLFSLYLQSDRPRALHLAQDLAALEPKNKDWPLLLHYAEALDQADAAIAKGDPKAAIAALENVVLPRYGADRRYLDLARAQALDLAGKTDAAYTGLVDIYIQKPNDDVHAAILGFGKKLGKTGASIDTEVMARRTASSKPGMPFKLVDYKTGKEVSLDDYKGRPVLVNFWYPKCGPCRGEFPYLEAVLEKYQSRGFAILAINGHPPEDGWVLPLIHGYKLDFVPLKGDDDIVREYKVRGFPSNFLYGGDGRIYYQPPPVSGLAAKRELELQIEALLPPEKA